MLDLALLRSFVSVVDAGGFTRAGERVHRTQSTVSQQIRRLEQTFGRPLLHRYGKRVTPTEEGERLLSYARRILALAAEGRDVVARPARDGGGGGGRLVSSARRILARAAEARDVVARPASDGVVRLGMSEDFAAYRLSEMLSEFVRARPGLRLDVRCGLSVDLRHALERGELDLGLFKRDLGEGGGVAAWPERLHWITSRRSQIDFRREPLPLAVFEQGCLYRNRAIHALEAAGRAWDMA